jgi:hypothetical protein
MRVPAHRSSTAKSTRATAHRIPPSNSLTHIRTLTAQMQRLEARVQSARSKLPGPGPANTPPRSSPRGIGVPSTVTVRSRKRTVGSTASSSAVSLAGSETTPSQPRHAPSDSRGSISSSTSKHVPRLSTSGVSRLSFGPLPNRNPASSSAYNADLDASRPSSRASISSYARPPSRAESHGMPPPRPMSRASLSSSRTPGGLSRPRSSLGMHGGVAYSTAEEDELPAGAPMNAPGYRTPIRRATYGRMDMESGIPLPGAGIPALPSRRQSGGAASAGSGRRTSSASTRVVLEDLGETY